MSPSEPKTDSKEFEVPDRAGEASSRNEAVSDCADITIRLWSLDGAAAAGPVSWKTGSVLVYMIADLVEASQGRVIELSSMTAHFDATGRAVVAARRIQTAVLEFLGCRPNDSLAVAILIHPPATTPGGFSAGMAQGALRLAEPGQILLAEEAARGLRSIPGIELRPVPALTTGGADSGLAELVWASPDEMARLNDLLRSGQHREEIVPMGATMIVNAPLAGPSTGKKALTDRGAAGFDGPETPATSGSHAVLGDLAPARDKLSQDSRDAGESPLLTRSRLILIGVAVLVAALVWLFYPSHVAKAPPRPPENPIGSESSSNPPSPAAQPASPQIPASEPATPAAATTKPSVPARTASAKHAKDRTPLAGTAQTPEPQPAQSVEGMTQNDIPKLLQMARSDAGGGNYDKARREYRIILQLQPSNTEAREGLRRLDIAQSDH